MVMIVWNFVATHSISRARAEAAQLESKVLVAGSASQEFAVLKSEAADLRKKAGILKEIGPKSSINVANVLAEISFLIDKRIVLSKVHFKAEKFADKPSGGANRGNAVRVAGVNFGGKETALLGDVRFKVVISGVASDGSDVAELICKLEDSPYFCQVIPSFSRNIEVKAGARGAGKNLQVSEFEISCYLANYREEESEAVKEGPTRKIERQ